MQMHSSISRSFFPSLFTHVVILATLIHSVAANPDGKGDKKQGGENGDPLTKEEREKIGQVLSKAWEEPEVIAAREEVHKAMELYKTTLEQAVGRIDPESVALMKQLHLSSRQQAVREKMGPHMFKGGPGRPPFNPEEFVQRLLRGEPAYEKMSPEQQEEFLKLGNALLQSGALDGPIHRIERAPGPREHGMARGEMRDLMVGKLMEEHEWIDEAIKAAPKKDRPREREFPPPPGGGDRPNDRNRGPKL